MTRAIIALVITVQLALSPAAFAEAQGRRNSAVRFDPSDGVTRAVLPNGMTVLIKERHDRPIVVTLLAYRVGSRNEQLGLTGLSHYLEHMLFKGTDKFQKGEIDLVTLKNGGENNAFTTSDYTGYWFKLASDRWETALEIEANRMRNSAFKPEEFAPEKQVVIEELQGGLDGPWGALSQAVWATAFTQHPYRSPVIGWIQDVKRATRDDMKAYYDRWYHPRNATLVIVGDVRAASAMDRVKSLFGKIPAGPEPAALRVVEPAQRGERRVVVKKTTQLERLIVSYHAPQVAHPDSYALQVAQTILGYGKTSRLYRRLQERDLSVTGVSAGYDERLDPSLFGVWAELKPGHRLADVEQAIAEEISELALHPVTQEELDRAKQLLEASFIMSNEDLMSQAEWLAGAEMQVAHPALPESERGYRYLATYLDRIHAVTAQDLQRVATVYLNADNRTVGHLVNEPKREHAPPNDRDGDPAAATADPDAALFAGDAPPASAPPRKPTRSAARKPLSPAAVKIPVERVVLPNGLVLLLSENRVTPTVSFAAVVKAGSRYEPDEHAGLASLVGELLEEGTERRTSAQIAEAIESVGGELSSGGGYSRGSVNARVLSKDFDLALELVADLLTRASFPEDRVRMAVERRLGEIKSRRESPATVASDLLDELIFEGHPAHRPPIGYESTVARLGRGEITGFYRRFYRPDNAVLAVAGDFDTKQAREKIEKVFAHWRGDGAFEPPAVRAVAPRPVAREKTVAVDKQQVNIYMGHPGIARSNPDYYAMQVFDMILGSSPGFSSRIPRILRDQQGLAYSAFSSITNSAGVDPGRFVAFIGCSPENAEKALVGLRREIRRAVAEPVSEPELADAKAYLTGSFAMRFETNTQIANFLLNAEIHGLGFDFPEKYPGLIQAVTVADVSRAARKYILPEALTTVIVGPGQAGKPGDR